MSDASDLLDIGEAAQFLNVSETSLRRWTNSGELPCLRVGRRRERRFRRADLVAFLDDQPGQPRTPHLQPVADSTRPLHELIPLTPGSHLCAFYDSELGRVGLAGRFLLEGLLEGSMVYLVASARSSKQILRHLKKRRPSLERDISDGSLLVSDYHQRPRAQIKNFETRLKQAAARGKQSFRVFGDVWEIRKRGSLTSFATYEAEYDRLIARRFPVVTVCAYDVRRFSGVDMLGAFKAHRDTFRYPLERALG
jgi:transcriptional repressor of dcmA and dcmR